MVDVVTSGARKIAIAYARRVAQWFYYIFLLMFTSSAIKLFIAELYHVPTDSMEQSVLVGDYILVNKLSYGARLPRSPLEIPWFNLLATNDNLFPWFRDTRWGYGRLSDTISISRDDIVVFEGPWDAGTVLVKRCRALPGDMIRLESDRVYVNDILVMEPKTVRYSYAFHEVAENESEETLTNESYYSLHPDTARATQARLGDVVLKLSAYLEDESNDLRTIQVPCKGLTINLNQFRHGLSYYVNIIQRYENAAIEVKDNIILINGTPDTTFTFKNNYYFMLGDNRKYSEDSRQWGFVSEQCIIGKATVVLFSRAEDRDQVRWQRILLGLNI